MNNKILRKAETYRKTHTKKQWLYRVLSVLAAGAVFCTTYALILPAITMEKDPTCGFTEHEHTSECYAEYTAEKTFSCLSDLHKHEESCFDSEGNILCGYSDYVVHTHNEFCFDESGGLICELPEIAEHIHNEECFAVHGDETEDHVHTEKCYIRQKGELLCGIEESDGHTHDEKCNGVISKTLVCEKEESEAHEHTDGCYETIITDHLLCGLEESKGHSHTESCFNESGDLICGLEESEGHFHSDECYEQTQHLVCELSEEGHIHDENCYEIVTGNICGMEESEGHIHNDDCYEWTETLICEAETEDAILTEDTEPEAICGFDEIILHEHTEECFDAEGNLICGQIQVLEHIHSEECFAAHEPELICGLEEHTHDEILCYIDTEADIENADDWEATLPTELSGDWASDLISVAQSQLDYTESETNVLVDAKGEVSHYSRYGAWYGRPYAEWNQIFLSFCLSYAGIPEEAIPQTDDTEDFISAASEMGILQDSDYSAQVGDIAILCDEYGINTVGIVTDFVTDENDAAVPVLISGDVDGAVVEDERADEYVVSYVSLAEAYNVYYGIADEEVPEDDTQNDTSETENEEVNVSEDAEINRNVSVVMSCESVNDETWIVLEAVFDGIDPSSYLWQWQTSYDGISDWMDIADAADVVYSFPASDENLAMYYRIYGTKYDDTLAAEPAVVMFSMRAIEEAAAEDETDADAQDYVVSDAVTPVALAEGDEVVNVGDYTVTLVLGGGTYTDTPKVDGNTLVSLPTPVLEGYIFDGWYLDEADNNRVIPPLEVTEDTIIYAKWIIYDKSSYYINFWNEDGTVVHVTGVYNYDTPVTEVNETTNESLIIPGHMIEGWYTEKNPGESSEKFTFNRTAGEVFNGSDTNVLNLYARYKLSVVVSFTSNGGTAIPSQTIIQDGTADEPTSPTRTGYNFNGWSTSEDTYEAFDFDTTIDENLTLYAFWTPKMVPVTLVYMYENADDDGYTYAGETQTVYAPTGSEIFVDEADTITMTTAHPVKYTLGEETLHAAATENGDSVATVPEVRDNYFDYTSSERKTVQGNGETVIQVLYNRVRVTLTFDSKNLYNNDTTLTGWTSLTEEQRTALKTKYNAIYEKANGNGFTYTFTAKYGQTITDVYPQVSWVTNGTGVNDGNAFQGWETPSSTQVSTIFNMVSSLFQENNDPTQNIEISSDGKLVAKHTLNAQQAVHYHYLLIYARTTLPGEVADFTYNGNDYTIYLEACQRTGANSNRGFDYKTIDGCTAIEGSPSVYQPYNNNDMNDRTMTRNQRTISLTDNNSQNVDTMREFFTSLFPGQTSDNPYCQILLYDRDTLTLTLNLNDDTNGTQNADYLYGDWIYNDNTDLLKTVEASIETGTIAKDGYLFAGWYTTPNFLDGTQFELTEETRIYANTILYAKWDPTQYSAEFYLYDEAGETPHRTQGFAENGYLTDWSVPTELQGTFLGWQWNGNLFNFNDAVGQANVDENGVMKLYALWNAENCKVSYLPGEGGDNTTQEKFLDKEFVINTSMVQLAGPNNLWDNNVPTTAELIFVGWLAPDGRIYQPGKFVRVTRPWMQFEAQWTTDAVKLIYDGNGHTNEAGNVTETWARNSNVTVWDNMDENYEGTVLTETAHFVKDGYEFIGWNTKADGTGDSYEPGSMITLSASETTLYAQWRPTDYTLTIEKYYNAANDSSTKIPLADAEFKLYSIDGTTETQIGATLPSGSEGTVIVSPKLQIGTLYKLIETKAPDGFILLTDPIYFRLTTDGKLEFCDANGNSITTPDYVGGTYNGTNPDNRLVTISVMNKAGYELPETGGIGTLPYTLGGLMIVGASGILFMYKTRRKQRG